jgi:cob(I)alamin adenosyltransferase
MIIVFTGNGKGKSSASLGLIIRALGWEKDVVVIRCFKGNWETGEAKFLRDLEKRYKNFKMYDFPIDRWLNKADNEGRKIIEMAIDKAHELILKLPFLVIIDEIILGFKFGILLEEEVIGIIDQAKDKGVNLVLTGRGWPSKLNKFADIITEMKEVKHIYKKGVTAVKGIDY